MPTGWHREDIKAAIRKRGQTLASLSRSAGYAESTLRAALIKPATPANAVIATFLSISLHELWPQWFDRHGRLRPQREGATRPGRPSSQKRSAA